MSKLIGIMGLKGSGKDTIAKMLPVEWKRMAFADTLKDIVSILFGWDRELIEGDSEYSRKWREEVNEYWAKELCNKNFTPRMALQVLGTDIFRNNFDRDIWVKVLKRKIINSNSDIVVTDVRFPNEANMIKSLGGKIVQVIRGELPEWWNDVADMNKNHRSSIDNNGNVEWIDKDGKIWSIHPSECSLAGVIEPDYVIHNDSTLDDLRVKVDEMLCKSY